MQSVIDPAPTIVLRRARTVLRSSKWSPGHLAPTDLNWVVANIDAASSLVSAFDRLDPKLPEPDPDVDLADLV
jgi:hypothetical protein